MLIDEAPHGSSRDGPQFLFILGAPRSANTATLSILDGHPDILAWPIEFPYFNLFNRLAKGRRTVPVAEINREILALLEKQLNEKLMQGTDTEGIVFTLGDTVGDLDTKALIEHLDRDRENRLGAVEYLTYLFDSLHFAHAAYRDRRVKYHAMLVTARGMDWQNERLFETSRFLFPYRDMVESYASIREKGLKLQSPPQFFAPTSKKGSLYWLQTFQRISQLAEERIPNGNFFVVPIRRVRYEPERVVSAICRFLEIEPHPALSQMSIAGQSYGGNARESALNTGTYAPRHSKLSIPLSSFEREAFALLDLYDFGSGEKIRNSAGLMTMAKYSLTSAFAELCDRKTSTWNGTGSRSTLLQRLKLSLKLFGIYLVLKGGYLSRLVPGRDSSYRLDSLS